MANDERNGRLGQPVAMRVYLHLRMSVTDPDAVLDLAEQRLREANIDWSSESETVDEAAAELRADLANSLASLVEIDRVLDGVPGVEVRGGRVWAERNEP